MTRILFAAPKATEYEVKAVYMYTFSLFTTWPESPTQKTDDIVVAIYGESELAPEMKRVATRRKVKGRTIRVTQPMTVEDIGKVHVLFVPSSVAADKVRRIIESQRGKPVLLVGETLDFTALGGAVTFRLEGSNVKFSLNTKATKKAKLKVGAKMQKLASQPQQPTSASIPSAANDTDRRAEKPSQAAASVN